MKEQSLWYLENIDVNGIFCPKKMEASHDQMNHRAFKKGEYIYLPDDSSDKVYFLTSGRVKVGTYGESGKEITKTILDPGNVFGELAMIGQKTRKDFAYAMEKSEACIVTVEEMNGLMKDHNALGLFFMRLMGSRALNMEKRLTSLIFKDSRSRIVEFLVDLVQKKGQRVGYEWVVRKFLTHQEIANLTATSRQTVTTTLNELRSDNMLTFNRKRLLIRDLDRLKKEIMPQN
jgi:CRP-like cAMP-binding protein